MAFGAAGRSCPELPGASCTEDQSLPRRLIVGWVQQYRQCGASDAWH